jgi:hypothetical protein
MSNMLLGIIIGVLGSWIAANLLPPLPIITEWYVNVLARFANWRAKRSIQAAQKRIQKLEAQLGNDKMRIQNTASFIAYIGRDIIRVSLLIVYYMGALLFLVWLWFVTAYKKVSDFLIGTSYTGIGTITLEIHKVLLSDLGILSYIVVISLFVFYGFLLINCHFALRRLLAIPFYAFGSFSCGFLIYPP